jgi:bifunctional non-homologous end joining protein LigD
MQRFEEVLDRLPKDCLFDGELVVLDDDGRPQFDELRFGPRRPAYVAFDLLFADGIDLAAPAHRAQGEAGADRRSTAEGWIALTKGVVGEGRTVYQAAVDADLEVILAKRLADPAIRSSPDRTRCSIAAIHSVAGAPNDFASAATRHANHSFDV